MKLIERVDEIEFSDAEQKRVSASLASGTGKPSEVLKVKAPLIRDADFWRRLQRDLKVTGFRPGAPGAISLVIHRAVDSFRPEFAGRGNRGWPLIWPLYRRAVELYLRDDLPTLLDLLRKEDFRPSSGGLTEQIFRCIRRSLPIHHATAANARELYELWGFERSDELEEILAANWIDADTVQRMLTEEIDGVRRDMASTNVAAKTDLANQLTRLTSDLRSLQDHLQQIRSELSSETAALIDKVTNLEDRLTLSTMQTAVRKGRPDATPKQELPKDEGTRERLAVLTRRLDALAQAVKRLAKGDPESARSVPSNRPPAVAETSVTAASVLEKWRPACAAAGFPCASAPTGWLLLEIIRRSRVVLTDKPQFLIKLYDSLSPAVTSHLAASPLWIAPSDWAETLTTMTQESLPARLLVVTDFDVGAQDAYLVPGILRFISEAPVLNRVVLVPSSADMSPISVRVPELATYLIHDAPFIKDLERIGSTIRVAPPILAVQQSQQAVLGFVKSENVAFEDQIQLIARNCGVNLPGRILSSFVSIYEGLRVALPTAQAAYVAREASLMPWVQQARGDDVAEVLERTLDAALGGG